MEVFKKARRSTRRREAGSASTQPSNVPSSAPTQSRPAGVQVIYGASDQSMPLAGLTVAQARELVSTIMQVDRNAPLLVNGSPAHANHVIAATDRLEFVHHAGEKGSVIGLAN